MRLRAPVGIGLTAAFLTCVPALRGDVVLYDGSLATTPAAQGWLFQANPGTSATHTAAGGVTVPPCSTPGR